MITDCGDPGPGVGSKLGPDLDITSLRGVVHWETRTCVTDKKQPPGSHFIDSKTIPGIQISPTYATHIFRDNGQAKIELGPCSSWLVIVPQLLLQ